MCEIKKWTRKEKLSLIMSAGKDEKKKSGIIKNMKKKVVAIFEGQQIRRHWDEEKELWYFSVIDIVTILTGSSIPRRYWSSPLLLRLLYKRQRPL